MEGTQPTFLSQPSPLMTFKLILIPDSLDTRITPGPRKRQLHRLVKQLKALNLFDRLLRALNTIKHDERLTLRLQVRLCDDIDDLAILGEEFGQSFFELRDFDVLFEVADVDTGEHGLVGAQNQRARVRVGVQ